MLARGMDIPGVECIINYEPPQQFRSYQHRVGRTARAGCRGTAYTLLAEEEVRTTCIVSLIFLPNCDHL